MKVLNVEIDVVKLGVLIEKHLEDYCLLSIEGDNTDPWRASEFVASGLGSIRSKLSDKKRAIAEDIAEQVNLPTRYVEEIFDKFVDIVKKRLVATAVQSRTEEINNKRSDALNAEVSERVAGVSVDEAANHLKGMTIADVQRRWAPDPEQPNNDDK